MEPVPEDLMGGYRPRRLSGRAREVLLVIYDNIGEKLNSDTVIRWLIAAVFFTLSTAFLVYEIIPHILARSILGGLFAIGGLLYTLFWYGLENRVFSLIEYWIGRLIRGEELLDPPMRVFGGAEYDKKIGNQKLTTNFLLRCMIYLFGLIFLFCAAYSFNDRYGWLHAPEIAVSTPVTIEEKLIQSAKRTSWEIHELKEEIRQLRKELKSHLSSVKKGRKGVWK